MLAGKKESAGITYGKMQKLFPEEWINNAFEVLGIKLGGARVSETPEPGRDVAESTPHRDEVAPRDEEPPKTTRRRRRFAEKREEAETDFYAISMMVQEVYLYVTTINSYDEGVHNEIRKIYSMIDEIRARNPEFYGELCKLDPATHISVLHDLQFSECLNSLRKARETNNIELEEGLKSRYTHIYPQCIEFVGKER